MWEVKHAMIVVKDEDGLPGPTCHLTVTRSATNPDEVKYFISNAPQKRHWGRCCGWRFRAGAWNAATKTRRRSRPGPLRRPALRGIETPSHSQLCQFSVPVARPRVAEGGNPELPVCQVRIATSAVIRGWSLHRAAAKQLIQQAAAEIACHQRRNDQARISHTRTTQQRLSQLGIDLTNIPAAPWDTG